MARSKSDPSPWAEECRAFAERLDGAAPDDPDILRDLLAAVHGLFTQCPLNLRKAFARLSEVELAAASETYANSCGDNGLHWPSQPFEPEYALRDAAIVARSLDLLLRDADVGRHVSRRNPAARWVTTDGAAYVIPLHCPKLPEAASRERAGFDKRGSLHHRVIPAIAEGLTVRLLVLRSIEQAPLQRRPLRGGVAAFPGLAADIDVGENGFLIEQVRVEGFDDKLRQQAADSAACDVFLWPELTINDDALRIIRSELNSRAFEEVSASGFSVAGSWHRRDKAGVMRNRAPILEGNGRLAGWFAKIALYGEQAIGFENAVEGDELLVIVADGFLATVCICKDFSDLQDRNPWTALPVDVVLVVSMGDDKTMSGHLVRAQELRKGYGRLTFIVQQGLWNFHEDPTNYFLPAPDGVPTDPRETAFAEDAQVAEFPQKVEGNLQEG